MVERVSVPIVPNIYIGPLRIMCDVGRFISYVLILVTTTFSLNVMRDNASTISIYNIERAIEAYNWFPVA